MVIILSAPSGCGKTTIAAKLVEAIPHLTRVVTCTTRAQRKGEVDGKDYFFLSEEQFKSKIQTQRFIEWALVHGHYYGTLKATLDAITNANNIPLLVIDVQGGVSWKKLMPHAISIFIEPESIEVLKKWLTERSTNTREEIALRLENAKAEMALASTYDYQVVNKDGHMEETAQEIIDIIQKSL